MRDHFKAILDAIYILFYSGLRQYSNDFIDVLKTIEK